MTFRSHFRVLLAVCIWLSMQMTSAAARVPILLACVLMSLPLHSAAQQPATATLRGVVTNAITGVPLPGATVSVINESLPATGGRGRGTSQLQLPAIELATTNSEGEFVFRSLDPGSYLLQVKNNGFAAEVQSRRYVLAAGGSISDLVVRMTPAGAISGRIRDAMGRPVSGINVSLLRRVYSADGTPGFSESAEAWTNDLGEYRIYWAPAGRYVVAANATSVKIAISFSSLRDAGLNQVLEKYAPAFFPGVPDVEKGVTIDLAPGGELRNIDFTVDRQKLYRIRGQVIDASTGKAPAAANVFIYGAGLLGSFGQGGGEYYDQATGTMNIRDLKPGRYTIRVTPGGGINSGIPPLALPAAVPVAWATVVIDDADVDNLTLTLAQAPVITGRFKVEGELPQPAALTSLRVDLRSPSVASPLNAAVAADGTFTLPTSPFGEFWVAVANLPPTLLLKDARLDGVDVLTVPARFSGAGNLEITISSNGGTIEGRVLDLQRRPISGIAVVLVPDAPSNRGELFKTGRTDLQGRFSLSGIAPGNYTVFSWEQLEAWAYFDPEVVKRFETQGTRVRVTASSRQNLEVTMIPAGDRQ